MRYSWELLYYMYINHVVNVPDIITHYWVCGRQWKSWICGYKTISHTNMTSGNLTMFLKHK